MEVLHEHEKSKADFPYYGMHNATT